METFINDYYDVKQLSAILGVSAGTIYANQYHGKIPRGQKIGERLLWRKNEIDEFVAKGGYADSEAFFATDRVAVRYFLTLPAERKKMGLTQEEFDKVLNLPRGTTNHYECGRSPSIDRYNHIAKALNWPYFVANRKDDSTDPPAENNAPKKEEPQNLSPQPQPPELLTIPETHAESIRVLSKIKGVKCSTILDSLLENALRPYKNALNVLKGFKLD
ncbi:MAG: helix-turn-helix domain-containing protein [Synergistaceae bacterium]|nr:helix-turn-helix domain-containing protein [Synergistaceae bacterium]